MQKAIDKIKVNRNQLHDQVCLRYTLCSGYLRPGCRMTVSGPRPRTRTCLEKSDLSQHISLQESLSRLVRRDIRRAVDRRG